MHNFDLNSNLAFASPEIIKREQERLLNEQVRYCRAKSPFYREKLAALPDRDLRLEDLPLLPLTSKHDVHTQNHAFIAAAPQDIADVVFTSGTTGRPCKIVYTLSDLQRIAYSDATGFRSTGMTDLDTALITCTLDRCFIAGLAYTMGTIRLGAATIRNGLNTLDSHADIIRHNDVTAIVGVPSFLVKLGDFLQSSHVDLDKIKHILCIGESLRDKDMARTPLAQKLEQHWPGRVYSTYASSEVVTSFTECSQRYGGHPAPDLGILEIIDANGNPLPPGEIGEVVITPLKLEGMPLLRFRTGDISFMMTEPCPCGRNTVRLGPILTRKAQMLKVKGTTLYPANFFNVLDQIDGVDNYYLEVTGDSLSDTIDLYISFNYGDLESLGVAEKLRSATRVNVRLHTVSCEAAHKKVFGTTRKPLRFFDLR